MRNLNLKKILRPWLLLVFLVCIASAKDAASYTIEDSTKVLKGNSWNTGTNGWVDVIPGADSVFEIYGMDANFSGGNLNISISTNYHGGEEEIVSGSLKTYPADFFIDIGLDGDFDYGVALSDHDFDNDLVASSPGDLYSNITYKTSDEYFENHSVYNYYGEAWDNPWDNVSDSVAVPVTIDEGTLVSGSNDFSWDLLSGINPGYLVSLSLSLNDLSIQGAENIGFLFSSANCANDIIAGSVHYPAPEPATMLLVGVGLLGLGMVSKRRFLHKAQEMDGLRVPPCN